MADKTDVSPTGASITTKLAYERTNLALERTMMAWVRTATSLITFGFTIYKFFQLEMRGMPRTDQIIGSREFALLMIVIGLFALLISTIQNWHERKNLRKEYAEIPRSLTVLVAGLISILGILAMVAVIFRM